MAAQAYIGVGVHNLYTDIDDIQLYIPIILSCIIRVQDAHLESLTYYFNM